MEHELTQKELARNLGISLRTYQRIESGRQKPNCNVVIKLQITFKQKIENILETDGRIKKPKLEKEESNGRDYQNRY